MSGDVQPRKRKDKRRKKGQLEAKRSEEYMEESAVFRRQSSTGSSPDHHTYLHQVDSPSPTRVKPDEEDLHHAGSAGPEEIIHIQKDLGLGGNICAKIVFFCLLGALGVMVGLIITEYRGSSEVDSQPALDSPWSLWLDGWIDDAPSHHEAEVDTGEIEDDHENSEEEIDSKEEDDESNEDLSQEEEEEDDDEHDNDEGDDGSEDDDEEEADVSGSEEEEEEYISNGDDENNSEEENESEEQEQEEDEDDVSEMDTVEESGENESEEDEDISEEKYASNLEESEEDVSDEVDERDSIQYVNESEEEEKDESGEADENGEVDESGEEEVDEEEDENDENDTSEEEEEKKEKNKSYEILTDESNELINKAKMKFRTKSSWFYKRNRGDQSSEQEVEGDDDEDEDEKQNIPSVTEADEDSKDEDAEDIGSERYRNALERWRAHQLCRPSKKTHKSGKKQKSATSSEEDVEEVAKISEILRRTTNKIKVELIDDIEEEEEKPKEVQVTEKEEESPAEDKVEQEDDESPPEAEGDQEEETSGMALKFGVGVALVVVAHVVLIQKWNTVAKGALEQDDSNETEVEGEIVPEIVRRQTLIPPSEEIPASAPPAEEYEYSEGEDEEEEEEEEDEEELVQKTYEDLRAQYHQQTPEGSDVEPTEEDFATKAPDTYDYSPTPPDSEPEEGPTESDVEEEDEEEDRDPMAEWKNRGPALLAEEVEDVQTGSESEDEPPPPVASSRRGGPLGIGELEQDYENADITNEADWEIKDDLDFADADLNDGKPEVALSKFTALLVRYPHSPRAHYGKARALDQLAEVQRSNQLLASAINTYLETLELPDVTDNLFLRLANRTIDRMRFRGLHLQAVAVHNKLITRYHNDSSHRIELAITYMMINKLDDAKLILKSSLDRWPEEGLTLAYYGLVLKLQGKHEECIPFLQKGLDSQASGTTNSHFYFHLGDTLQRKGEVDKAMELYEKGATKGLFRSKYQRSLYNVDHLKAQPWWSIEETTYTQFFRKLEDNWKIIRDEGIAALKAQKGFMDESESLRDTGNWKQFELFARGQKHRTNCNHTPVTCRLIDDFKPASNCRRGQSKFSVMEGGTHVWAHCGPTNCRLRTHLGLVVPNGTAIRVAETTRSWSEGKILIFDDSFEHEVWHNGTENRLVLIVDVWHPELTAQERSTITAI